MKRVSLLMIMALLLVTGCAVGEVAQDTTSSLVANNGGSEPINVMVDEINCAVFPVEDSGLANAVCQLGVVEDAAKWGDTDESIHLIGSGQLRVPENVVIFPQPFIIYGKGSMSTYPLQKGWENNVTIPAGIPSLTIDAEVEGGSLAKEGDVELILSTVGMSGSEMTEGFISEEWLNEYVAVMTHPSAVKAGEADAFLATTCQGFLIPGSPVASIIMIGELKDGSQVMVSGLTDAGELSDVKTLTPFACEGMSAGEIQVDGKAALAVVQSEGLRLKLGEGDIIDLNSFILGFNLGMPPT